MVRGKMGRPSGSRGRAMKLGSESRPPRAAWRGVLTGACRRTGADTLTTRPSEKVTATDLPSSGRVTLAEARPTGRPGGVGREGSAESAVSPVTQGGPVPTRQGRVPTVHDDCKMQVYSVLEPGGQARRRPAGGRAWAARRGGSRATANDCCKSVQDLDVHAWEAMGQKSDSLCSDVSQRAGIRD